MLASQKGLEQHETQRKAQVDSDVHFHPWKQSHAERVNAQNGAFLFGVPFKAKRDPPIAPH